MPPAFSRIFYNSYYVEKGGTIMCTLIATILGVSVFGNNCVDDGLKSKEAYPFIVMLGWTWILEVLAMFVKLVFRTFRKK